MAQLMEYADYLAKEIGPRPAGTEEEQQAALYITECFQKDAGFPAQLEEFTTGSNLEGIAAIPGIVIIVVAVLGMIFPILSVPAFILAAICAALYALEAFGSPLITRFLARGASQNVVAKYQPNPEASAVTNGRGRKVVLVAHYDSGKVTPPIVKRIESLKLPVPVGLICVCAMIAAAFFMLIHIFANAGMGAIVVNVLTAICLVVCAYPVLRAILYRIAPYNEGANNNATGTAALLEAARRISRGSVSEADLIEEYGEDGIVIHGEAAAREHDLVPEGAQIRYEASQLVPPSEIGSYDDEERLLAAKAAIEALTGQPIEKRAYGSVAESLVNSRAQAADAMPLDGGAAPEPVQDLQGEDFAPEEEPVQPQESVSYAPMSYDARVSTAWPEVAPIGSDVSGYQNAPSWFVAAQQNAKRPDQTGEIHRSKYAMAIEAAEREAEERERERQEQERLAREEELRAREEALQAREAELRAREEQVQRAAAQPEPSEGAPFESGYDAVLAFGEEAPRAQVSDDEVSGAHAGRDRRFEPSDGAATAVAASGEPKAVENPVFVPYSEAMAHAKHEAKPADAPETPEASERAVHDDYADSLGSTIAFDPRQLREMELPAVVGQEDAGAAGVPAQPRLSGLPSIEDEPKPVARPEKVEPQQNPSRSGMFRKLREDVPSLSGVIRMQEAGEDVSQKPVSSEIPRIDAARTQTVGSVAPAMEEEVAPAPAARADGAERPKAAPRPEPEPYRQDEGEPVERPRQQRPSVSGARVVGSPEREARAQGGENGEKGGFMSRFRRKSPERLSETPQEWLDVDEDFDARTVGRNRGSWESFRDDAYDEPGEYGDGYDGYGEYGDGYEPNGENRRWEGGAYSRVRLGRVDTRSGEDSEADMPAVFDDMEEEDQIADEIEHIYHFRNPLFNTEVWFVALGAEVGLHDGTKAFLAEHGDEMRGAMIIEVESLGAGDLAVAEREGRMKVVPASSRVKRFTRIATAATGIAPGTVDLAGFDSAASIMQEAGHQTMHLLGVEDGAPALKGSPDDVLENVDDLLLDDNVNFIMELLKQ